MRLESCPPFQQCLPDGFGLGFMSQACYLARQPLDVRILDISGPCSNLLIFYQFYQSGVIWNSDLDQGFPAELEPQRGKPQRQPHP